MALGFSLTSLNKITDNFPVDDDDDKPLVIHKRKSKSNPQLIEDESEHFKIKMNPNPEDFMKTLQHRFGTTEEFHQFERYFYAQREEVVILRKNVENYRLTLEKLQDEKRKLELQLVSEKASREQDSKNALTDIEKKQMQQSTKMYSVQCEVETWKRKAEATLKESDWLKDQLKSLEVEKTEAVRKYEEYARKNVEMDQYKSSIDAYANRQKETLKNIQSRILDLEKVRDGVLELSEENEKKVKQLSVHLKALESSRLESANQIMELQRELIEARGELVQNNAELSRLQSLEDKTNQLIDQLTSENKDLMQGFNGLVETMQNKIKIEDGEDFMTNLLKLNDEANKLQVQDKDVPSL